MPRYRPPRPPSSPYITADGDRRLRAELDDLWRRRRPEVTKALSAAAAEGDRSENAEYIYRKKQLAEIDRRIRYLRKRLAVLKVVASPPSDTTRIFFGAWIRLENSRGDRFRFRIVGSDEFDTAKDYISLDSPMARALMQKSVGDQVQVDLPEGRTELLVVEVSYSEFEPS
jgi:transcription elongation factor GreB